MMKAANIVVTHHLVQLCRDIWTSESVPREWKSGVIVSFYKNKGDSRDPSNYRPITLLSIPSKVVVSIIISRIQPHLLTKRRPQQAGFTPRRSTTDCILALQVLAQERREYKKQLLAAYVDLKAAFDSLDRQALWLLLKGIGVPSKYINILRDLYSDTTCRVFADGAFSEAFSTTSGVRQGCVAAPNLFNVAVDYWIGRSLERSPDLGVELHERYTDFDYADDVVLLAELFDTFSDALRILSEEASPLGLTISWAKTKIQSLSDYAAADAPPPNVRVGAQEVEVVDSFIYLGSKITRDCSSDQEIIRRIQLARSAFGRLSRVWKSTSFRTTTKLRLLDSTVYSVLLYGCATWTLSAAMSRRLDAFQRSCLRNILGIRWNDFIPNEEVYARAGNPTPITTTIKERRLQLLGHVARLPEDTPARRVLVDASGPPPHGWRRPRGRPRLRWTTQVVSALPRPHPKDPLQYLLSSASDRDTFREIVSTAYPRP